MMGSEATRTVVMSPPRTRPGSVHATILKYSSRVRLTHVLRVTGAASNGIGFLDEPTFEAVMGALQIVNGGALHPMLHAESFHSLLFSLLLDADARLHSAGRATTIFGKGTRYVPFRLVVYALSAMTLDTFDATLLPFRIAPADVQSGGESRLDFDTLATFFAGLLAAQQATTMIMPTLRAVSPGGPRTPASPRADDVASPEHRAMSPRVGTLARVPSNLTLSLTLEPPGAEALSPSSPRRIAASSRLAAVIAERGAGIVMQARRHAARVLADCHSERFTGKPGWLSPITGLGTEQQTTPSEHAAGAQLGEAAQHDRVRSTSSAPVVTPASPRAKLYHGSSFVSTSPAPIEASVETLTITPELYGQWLDAVGGIASVLERPATS